MARTMMSGASMPGAVHWSDAWPPSARGVTHLPVRPRSLSVDGEIACRRQRAEGLENVAARNHLDSTFPGETSRALSGRGDTRIAQKGCERQPSWRSWREIWRRRNYDCARRRSSSSTTRSISDSGAGLPVQISNWRAPCWTNISRPLMTARPRALASFKSGVSSGV
jgi:hypothetical protein